MSEPRASCSPARASSAATSGSATTERILSVLPFSFDYGLNQLLTAVEQGATTILLTFRFGHEIVRAIHDEEATALAGVPGLWAVLCDATPALHKQPLPSLRYLTNSGGAMPLATLARIRAAQPQARRRADVRPHRGVSLDLSAGRGARPAPDLDRQGDSRDRGPAGRRSRQCLPAGRDGRCWSTTGRRSSSATGAARTTRAPSFGRTRSVPEGRPPGVLQRGPGDDGRGRLPLLRRARRRDDQVLRLPDQSHRGRERPARGRRGARGRRHRRPGPGARAIHQGHRVVARRDVARRRRPARASAPSACRATWCRRPSRSSTALPKNRARQGRLSAAAAREPRR